MRCSVSDEIDVNGYTVTGPVLRHSQCETLLDLLSGLPDDSATRRRGQHAFARRNLLELPAIQSFANLLDLRSLVDPILGSTAKPVRGILFDKHASANWIVPWHQDRSIAVQKRIDTPGFGPWSEKAGVIHVQPPLEVLHQMITLRIHLDRCHAEDGALRVVPGTHKTILMPQELDECVNVKPIFTCEAESGMVVIMRPLLLHSSLPATNPSHRRVIHIEYAAYDLPNGLCWQADQSQTIHLTNNTGATHARH